PMSYNCRCTTSLYITLFNHFLLPITIGNALAGARSEQKPAFYMPFLAAKKPPLRRVTVSCKPSSITDGG
ncbi:hypothetical protein ACFQWB_07765, partial [Paenibacillus thermoaerophilus]